VGWPLKKMLIIRIRGRKGRSGEFGIIVMIWCIIGSDDADA